MIQAWTFGDQNTYVVDLIIIDLYLEWLGVDRLFAVDAEPKVCCNVLGSWSAAPRLRPVVLPVAVGRGVYGPIRWGWIRRTYVRLIQTSPLEWTCVGNGNGRRGVERTAFDSIVPPAYHHGAGFAWTTLVASKSVHFPVGRPRRQPKA
jgi:hypothetical protein